MLTINGVDINTINVNINRTPSISYLSDIINGKLKGPVAKSTDFGKEIFQISFSCYNTRYNLDSLLDSFETTIQSPCKANDTFFSDAILYNLTIDNSKISGNIAAYNPSKISTLSQSPELNPTHICYTGTPSYLQFKQLGNYIFVKDTLSSIPTILDSSVNLVDNISGVNIYKVTPSNALNVIPFIHGGISSYIYNIFPELFKAPYLTYDGKQVNITHLNHSSCNNVITKIYNIDTNRTYYINNSQIELPPGNYNISSLIRIPITSTTYYDIESDFSYISIPNITTIDMVSQTNVIEGNPITINTFSLCKVTIGSNVFYVNGSKDITLPPGTYDIKISSNNKVIYNNTINVYPSNTHFDNESSIIINDLEYNEIPAAYISFSQEYLIKNKDILMYVYSTEIPTNIESPNNTVLHIDDNIYSITFNNDGWNTIYIYIGDTIITKEVLIGNNINDIINISNNIITITTGNFVALVSTPTQLIQVQPNTSATINETIFGIGDIDVKIVFGNGTIIEHTLTHMFTDTSNLQIIHDNGTLLLLNTSFVNVSGIYWYIDNTYVGNGDSLQIPSTVPPGIHEITTVLYLNNNKFILNNTLNIIPYIQPSIELSSELITRTRSEHLSTTNKIVKFNNIGNNIKFNYPTGNKDFILTKYINLDNYNIVGNYTDLNIT